MNIKENELTNKVTKKNKIIKNNYEKLYFYNIY